MALLLFVIAFRVFYRELGMQPGFGYDKIFTLTLSVAFMAIAVAARRLSTKFILLMFSVLLATAAVQVTCSLMGIDLGTSLKNALVSILTRTHVESVTQLDDRYGHRNQPGARGGHRTMDFDVEYTIDETGYRVTPSPAVVDATVLITGGSFTFGEGVGDEENFCFLLGRDYWPRTKIVNASSGGWGPTQALLSIVDALWQETLPDVVVYAMISHHQLRTDLRPPLVHGIPRRVEFHEGGLAVRDTGWSDAEGYPQRSETGIDALLEQEIEWTREVILEMHRAGQDKNVPFVLLLLPDGGGKYEPGLVNALGAGGVRLIDLTRIEFEGFAHDAHPTPAAHRRIAEAISQSRLEALVRP